MKSTIPIPIERKPVVAGRFYPASSNELLTEINNLHNAALKISQKKVESSDEILAVISPHAGYVFSGTVAASAFGLLKNNKSIKRVFLLGSSHYAWYDGVSIYFKGQYTTPLGKIEVDTDLATELLDNNTIFDFKLEAHVHEHCLEVQLPFLQYFLKSKFKIIPILLGGQSVDTPKKVADILSPNFGGENLFVISTDLSHYPEYNDALKVDKNTITALCSNNPDVFLEQLKDNERKKYDNLSTSMCGWTSALTLLHITSKLKGISYIPILYQNSGEIPIYGDKSRVVGYQSVAICRKANSESESEALSEEDKNMLLSLARDSIVRKIKANEPDVHIHARILEKYLKPQGAFVSIYVNKELRGCIGKIESENPLYKTIEQTAVSAATNDVRFKSIQPEELDKMKIELSILSPLKKINSIDEIIPGKHGILIRKGIQSGTFLPQVATRTGWNTIEMLEQCAERKAGLGKDGWQDADIYTYEALIISEKDQD